VNQDRGCCQPTLVQLVAGPWQLPPHGQAGRCRICSYIDFKFQLCCPAHFRCAAHQELQIAAAAAAAACLNSVPERSSSMGIVEKHAAWKHAAFKHAAFCSCSQRHQQHVFQRHPEVCPPHHGASPTPDKLLCQHVAAITAHPTHTHLVITDLVHHVIPRRHVGNGDSCKGHLKRNRPAAANSTGYLPCPFDTNVTAQQSIPHTQKVQSFMFE